MKHLLTISALLVSSLAMAQFPNLPYNPDENGDGFIGVVDLQGLLANYGNEFASAVISEDGESAIVAMGQMQYPVCAFTCKSLPGFWDIPTLEQFGMIWDEVGIETTQNNSSSRYYVRPSNPDTYSSNYQVQVFNRYVWNYGVDGFSMSADDLEYQCYCAAKQLPRVEYSWCAAFNSISNDTDDTIGNAVATFQACCDAKVQDGWYPLGGLSKGGAADGSQAFWRWAE